MCAACAATAMTAAGAATGLRVWFRARIANARVLRVVTALLLLVALAAVAVGSA